MQNRFTFDVEMTLNFKEGGEGRLIVRITFDLDGEADMSIDDVQVMDRGYAVPTASWLTRLIDADTKLHAHLFERALAARAV